MIISTSARNASAAAAYAKTQSALETGDVFDASSSLSAANEGNDDFAKILSEKIEGVISSSKDAESKAASGLNGKGSLTDIVTSVSQAQMVLQAASVIRDKVIQSYQDIMRMSI